MSIDTDAVEESRSEFSDYVRRQLIGPFDGLDEVLDYNYLPQDRYLMGKLYPVDAELGEENDDQEAEDVGAGASGEEWSDSPISLAQQRLPASVGLSFFFEGTRKFSVSLEGARYRLVHYVEAEYFWAEEDVPEKALQELKDLTHSLRSSEVVAAVVSEEDVDARVASISMQAGEEVDPMELRRLIEANPTEILQPTPKVWTRRQWEREDISSKVREHTLSCEEPEIDGVLGGRADLRSFWRPMKNGFLVTVSLVNNAKSRDGISAQAEDSLYQVSIKVHTDDEVEMRPYPRSYAKARGSEEEELDVIYRDRITYAVGHGSSVLWDTDASGEVNMVRTEYLPEKAVPDLSTVIDGIDEGTLSIQYLADETVPSVELRARLEAFVSEYQKWLNQQKKEKVPTNLEAAKERILCRIESVIARMHKGIDYLCNDDGDGLARKVFALANRAMLMQMAHQAYKKCALGESKAETPDYFGEDFKDKRWRPFQLGFQLLALESVLNESSEDRDIVDLIWFPTGGGKTEAYLVLAAMEIFHRRLKLGDKGFGTAVLKRYTLRLLTSQQFERASRLICACELLRHEIPELGEEPITLGLWVGEGVSPNKYTVTGDYGSGALEKHDRAIDAEEPLVFFSLTACPWCGTSIYPKTRSEETHYGTRASETSFDIFCPDYRCKFHKLLPVNVVDQHLYEKPPTLVVATIDKLARAAWDDRSRSIFGYRDKGENVRPPSLVIQDELHLISGPLGTVAGVYEAAFDVLMDRPKIIAATATIRRADDQVKRLYGRGLSIFPPPGLNASNSFFSREVPLTEKPGRLYLGCMGQGTTSTYSVVHLAASLAMAPKELEFKAATGDGYWTQVIFSNSRRELGKVMTLAVDDIPSRIRLISKDEAKLRELKVVTELSANCGSEDIPAIIDSMDIPMDKDGVIDILPCTNMLSVGVDIQRLGLMLVNGQPKTTAEYIQASSRVGRGKFPGLVFAHYSPSKPRDRSHYETFYSYHDALYRAVEPTSVTPYAEPAMIRALHAALVILMRHAGGLPKERDASKFDPENERHKDLIARLKERVRQAVPEINKQEALDFIDYRVMEWAGKAAGAAQGKPLVYDSKPGKQFVSLLCSFEKKVDGAWPTLNSMRHVENECVIRVDGEKRAET